MKREIKFRALCDFEGTDGKDGLKMIYFGAEEFEDGVKAWPIPKFLAIHSINSYESPLMQYTGLKDKNGKEIYEGDVLEKNYGATIKRFTVSWHKERMAFINQDGFNELLFHTPLEMCEIIGNIYENQNLIVPDAQ